MIEPHLYCILFYILKLFAFSPHLFYALIDHLLVTVNSTAKITAS